MIRLSDVLRGCVAALVFGALLFATNSGVHAQRLPQTVIPSHYRLELTPDLKAATFAGSEQIDVELKEPTAKIVLNSAEIEFKRVTVSASGQQQIATVSTDTATEQTTFTFANALPAGKAVLSIEYAGILNGKLRGFYLSKTEKRNYAVTQFESTDARRAFPSFDEPAFKATYDVTLVVDKGDTAISNTPIKSDTPGPGPEKHSLAFDTTPKMSTYLVAFLVGDFQCSAGEQDDVQIRVCSTPDKVELTHYGVDVAKYVLHYFNGYFGIPYPLKKLDLIGLPDFEAGAMENFGAITYRETALLIDPKTASVGSKKGVESVIAHEMAHQWFGDLVTMQWWNNVWLNEGFATWLSNKPLAAMHPEWNIDQDVIAEEDGTLNLDAQPTTRPIRAKADTREEIEQMFDGISYGKASDVLLMVENYVGEETFRKGVHRYLEGHLYGNATAEDFWNAQTETSHKPVDKIMESLVAQPGAPILTFGEPGKNQVSVTQKRFFLSPNASAEVSNQWTLPVCFRAAANKQTCELLTPGQNRLQIPSGDLFLANATGKGYYRTAYPADVYAKIVARVEADLTPAERINLIGDEWAQVRAGKTDIGAYLDLVTAVSKDQNAGVIRAAMGGVNTAIERVAATPEEKQEMGKWLRATFSTELAKLGPPSPSDADNKRELRANLFQTLGYFGDDPAVLQQAKELAEKYIEDPASVEPSLGQTAMFIAARKGDVALFDKLQHVYETSTSPEIQINALRMLPLFEDPELERRALDYSVTSKVRNQDAAIQFAMALDVPANREMAWSYVKEHWDKISTLLTPEMGNYLVGAAGEFCTAESRDDVQQFFANHKVASADRAAQHSVERINGCVEFRKAQEPVLKHWLAAHVH